MPSRRRFVASAVAGAAATLAGCTGGGGDGYETTRPPATGVDSRGFVWDTPGTGEDHEPSGEPSVTFADPNGVTVEGALRYGSSTCDRIALDELAVEGGALRVRVASARKRAEPETCTDDLSAAGYRVSVTLDGGLPERVVVTEAPARGDPRTHTATPD